MHPTVPPKLLLAVPRLNIGGAESYVASLASTLQRRGYQVLLASGGGILARELIADGIRHYLVPMRWNARLAGMRLAMIMRREGITLLHANSSAAAEAAYHAGKRTGIPWIMTAHSLMLRSPRYNCFRNAERIICVSDFLRKAEIEQNMFDATRLVTIFNGIDLTQFSQLSVARDLRQDWQFSRADFVIVLASRMRNAQDKGHHDLFRVLAEDHRALKWKLVVAGKGRALKLLQRMTRQLGIAERVRFVGHTLNMATIYGAGDVVCLPSKMETFGMTLAEGMALSKPTVAYAVGGIPEVIDEGITGFLVPNGDRQKLGDRLNDLYQNPILAREMGARGRTRVENLFEIGHMTDNIEALYHEVIAETTYKVQN